VVKPPQWTGVGAIVVGSVVVGWGVGTCVGTVMVGSAVVGLEVLGRLVVALVGLGGIVVDRVVGWNVGRIVGGAEEEEERLQSTVQFPPVTAAAAPLS